MEQSKKIDTILKCFVDLNLETNENFLYSNFSAKKISFEKFIYSVDEGDLVKIIVGLDSPSEYGFEQFRISLINITTGQEDIDREGFPKTIKFEIGEQYKEIEIKINNDFYEEGVERFHVALTSLVNVLPGNIVRTVVEVIDKTVLKTASLITTGGTNVDLSETEKEFQIKVSKGETVDIGVMLDSPSEYGIEQLDVEFYDTSFSLNGSLFDSQIVNREQFSFSAGEQYKTKTILGNIEEDFEFKKIGFKLIDPTFVKITASQLYNQGQIVLTDNSYNVLYSTFVIDDIFKQKGKIYDGITTSILELRYFSQNSNIVSSNSRQIANWLVRYNFMYEDHFNDSIRQEMANYNLYPNFSFKSMKLVVTNKGEFAVEYDGKIYDKDQSFEFDLVQNMNSITLPTNTNPITDLPSDVSAVSGIESSSGKMTRGQTLASCRYSFSLKYAEDKFYDSTGNLSFPHGFKIKNGAIDTLQLGEFIKNGTTYAQSILTPFRLISRYSGVKTNYNGICGNDFNAPNTIQNVKIKGVILIDESYNDTNYIDFSFTRNGDVEPVCEIKNGIEFGIGWTTVPFEVF